MATRQAFVTGGSGFIGRRLIEELSARGVPVGALSRSPDAAAAVQRAGATAHDGDIVDVGALSDGMAGADTVFHLAGKVTDWGRDEEFERINVRGTRAVLSAARSAGVRRVVLMSGEAVLLSDRPLVDVDETYPYPARHPGTYARTKAESERLVVAANGDGIETVVVRAKHVWDSTDATLTKLLVDAVRTGRFRWIDGGRQLTSTTHVRNAVHGLLLAAELGRPGEIYFVTDGPPIELRTFVSALLASAGVEAPDRSISYPMARLAATVVEPVWRIMRPNHAPPMTRSAVAVLGLQSTLVDTKARAELGYEPVIPLEDALRAMRSPGPTPQAGPPGGQ